MKIADIANNQQFLFVNYVREHGDGWESTNTGRLACFARFIDAMSEQKELIDFRDQHTNQ